MLFFILALVKFSGLAKMRVEISIKANLVGYRAKALVTLDRLGRARLNWFYKASIAIKFFSSKIHLSVTININK